MRTSSPREGRTWPGYVLGGRLRTSTLVLIIAFLGIGWLYETYEPGPSVPEQIPASEVVPPGFIPDPAYTWAPRTDVQRQGPATTTTTTSATPTTTSTTPSTATTPGSSTESTAPSTPGEPTPPPTPAPDGSPAPSSAPSTPESAAPAASARPTAPSTTAAVPAGGAAPTTEPPTR